MAGDSPLSFAASKAAGKVWKSLSAAQRKTVLKLREAQSSGSPIELARWHQLGDLAQTLSANGRATYGHQTVDSLAELVGCSPSVISKARKFAQVCTASEALKLESKLSWSAIGRLIAIEDAATRKKLISDCVSHDWSLRELEREIRARVGRQRNFGHGGRSGRRPRTLNELLGDLDRLLVPVLHWYRNLEPAESAKGGRPDQATSRSSSSQSCSVEQLPLPLRRRVVETMRGLEELRHAVQGAMEVGVIEAPNPIAGRGRTRSRS